MMEDAHRIFDFSSRWLKENGYWGPIFVMGRSLGSASAIELAAVHPERIAGLIVESGFADTAALLELLGINVRGLGLAGRPLLRNAAKMAGIAAPTLIIHGESDRIIPHTDGLALYEACPSAAKRMLTIRGADHNDLLARGFDDYMHAVQDLVMEDTG
jgi:pimeloyl-ACP methyl ester carboxylesterase